MNIHSLSRNPFVSGMTIKPVNAWVHDPEEGGLCQDTTT